MPIYLDANVLWPWPKLTEIDRLAVGIVAHQLGQEIFIPAVAATEAEEKVRRSLVGAVDRLYDAQRNTERLFDEEFALILEPHPEVDERVAKWRHRLEEFASVLPLDDADAREALDREIKGVRPAQPRQGDKPGKGGRDAAIWLTALHHHRAQDAPSYLLSGDQGGFGSNGQLHDELRRELADSAPMELYSSTAAFVARLGNATTETSAISLDELGSKGELALQAGIEASREAANAVWPELEPEFRYMTSVVESKPIKILDARRYEGDKEAVLLVNSEWTIIAACCYQRRDTEEPDEWLVIPGIDMDVTAQFFFKEQSGSFGSAQFLAAQVTSETSFSVHGDSISIFSRL